MTDTASKPLGTVLTLATAACRTGGWPWVAGLGVLLQIVSLLRRR